MNNLHIYILSEGKFGVKDTKISIEEKIGKITYWYFKTDCIRTEQKQLRRKEREVDRKIYNSRNMFNTFLVGPHNNGCDEYNRNWYQLSHDNSDVNVV